MAGLAIIVLGIATLLALTAAMQPVARFLGVPLSLVLVLLGSALGVAIEGYGEALGVLASISGESFLYLFLPILLFETAIEIDVRRLLVDFTHILHLAVVAVVASTLVIGFALSSVSSYSLVACLLVAAIVSTTDPVAVVSLFKDLSVPHRLTLLVEGESLFNDAAAIAAFTVLMGILATGNGEAAEGIWTFLRSFTGGVLVGYGLGLVATRLLVHLFGERMAEVTVTVAVAYLSFAVSEAVLHVSGVVAVVVAALVFAYDGRTRVAPKTWTFLVGTWKQLGYLASSLIFLLAALRIPGLLKDVRPSDAILFGALLIGALGARGLVLFILMPLMTAVGLGQKVDVGLRLVILWGGLRGAISLALALAVVENPGVPPEVKRLVSILVTSFVLFTLFINGLTLRPLIRLLGIDRLEPVDRFLRGRALAHSLATVRHRLESAAGRYRIEHKAQEALAQAYTDRLAEAEGQLAGEANLSESECFRASLVRAAQHEQMVYYQHYRERIVSGKIIRNLVARAYLLEDGAREGGQADYEAAAKEELDFPVSFRFSVEMQRRLGWQWRLARDLADRQESLLVIRATLHTLLHFATHRIPDMLGPLAADFLGVVLARRLAGVEQALAALQLQHGEFFESMQARYLERAALRIEFSEIQSLIDDALISREVFNELLRDIESRRRMAHRRPPLDLKLHPEALLARVPFFHGLPPEALAACVPLMKPRFVLPGEAIIRAGEKGREMYFLASGAVQVNLASGPRCLGSGDFFGELALLTHAPRAADVVALGYCELLVMTARDFADFLGRHTDLSEHISQVVKVRLAQT